MTTTPAATAAAKISAAIDIAEQLGAHDYRLALAEMLGELQTHEGVGPDDLGAAIQEIRARDAQAVRVHKIQGYRHLPNDNLAMFTRDGSQQAAVQLAQNLKHLAAEEAGQAIREVAIEDAADIRHATA